MGSELVVNELDVSPGAAAPIDARSGQMAIDIRTYLEYLRLDRGLAPNSLSAYERDLRRYHTYCRSRGLTRTDEIPNEVVVQYLEHLTNSRDGAGLSTASAARMIVAVRGFHRYAADAGFSIADPGKGIHPPSAARREPLTLAPDEVTAILDGVGGSGAGPLGLRDRALLELLYGTGARISEAVGLNLVDLDLDGQIAVLAAGGRHREVPLGPTAAECLDRYLQLARPALRNAVQPAVFLNARGGRLSRQSAWTVLQAAADRSRLGVTVSPHTLRHSFAAHMLSGGADPTVVDYLLGHAGAARCALAGDVLALREVHLATHPRSRRRNPGPGT